MADTTNTETLGAAIDAILDDATTRHLVDIYFEDDRFAGIDFDSLGPSAPNTFSPADLLALNLLDVRVGPRAMRAILSGRFDSLLSQIPVDVDLWDARSGDGSVWSNADALYSLLLELPGMGRTKTSKLLARKRPRLVPIRDSIIENRLGLGEQFWAPLADVLSDDERRRRIDALTPTVHVSTLRRLDIAVWMTGSGSENAIDAREAARRRSVAS